MSLKDSIEQFLIGLSDSLIGIFNIFKRRSSSSSFDSPTMSLSSASDFKSQQQQSRASNKIRLSKKLHDNIFFICKLNGLLFLTIVFYLHYIFKPILSWLIERFIFTQIQFIFNFFITNVFDLFIIYFWSLSSIFLYFSFQIFILKEKNEQKQKKYCYIKLVYKYAKKSIINIADVFIVFSFELVLFVQSLLMCFIPVHWLSQLFFHLHFSYLLSFLVFNFKWSLMSWNLNTRLTFMESRFSYFLGFGLVLSIILSLPDSFIYSAILASFLFPCFLFNAIETNCEHLKPVNLRFPIFDFTFSLFSFVSSFIGKSKPQKFGKINEKMKSE